MKFKFDISDKAQPDPYIFKDANMLYLFVTGTKGVEAYSAKNLEDIWHYEGIVCTVPGGEDYWAPCIIKIDGMYYLYFSCTVGKDVEFMHVASSDKVLGPFENSKTLFDRFTIDAHIVKTKSGLFLFYAEDNKSCEYIGTRVFVDRLIDPYTPAGLQKEVVVPSFEQEIYMHNRYGDGKNWYTIEGPFWFEKDGVQYLMYSGGCFENDTYHIGYCTAFSDNTDLINVKFVKHTFNGEFDPFMIKNEHEEGTGHHSVFFDGDDYYIIYHARDVGEPTGSPRTARFCQFTINNGILTACR